MSASLANPRFGYDTGSARSRQRHLGLAPAGRLLGLEQCGPDRRRRRVAARRHALRPATHARDARRDARRGARGAAHRHAREHPLERRPLLRQRARPRGRDRRHARVRRGDGARDARRCSPSSSAARRSSGRLGAYVLHCFGAFDFDGITPRLPTRTFEGRLDLAVGAKRVELIEVGPAHTRGDAMVFVPGDRTIFTGDILFIDGTPIVWAGPVAELDRRLRAHRRARRRDDRARPRPDHDAARRRRRARLPRLRPRRGAHALRRRPVGARRRLRHRARRLRVLGRRRAHRRQRRHALPRVRARRAPRERRRTLRPDGRTASHEARDEKGDGPASWTGRGLEGQTSARCVPQSTASQRRGPSPFSSEALDEGAGAEAAAAAHGDQRAATAGALELVERGGDQAVAGAAGRVAERDRAAVRVHALGDRLALASARRAPPTRRLRSPRRRRMSSIARPVCARAACAWRESGPSASSRDRRRRWCRRRCARAA